MLCLENLLLAQQDFRLTADWSVQPGKSVAVIGPSGAGKSTLLHAIAGFLAPTRGRIMWGGQDLAGVPPGARPMTTLFQDQNLFPHLSLAQNLGLGLRVDLRLSKAQAAQVAAALDRVGLHGLADRRAAQLSGGQIGRAALARALLRARPLLLLDEPFAALGPALKADMLALLREVAEDNGATVLMVTHDPQDAKGFADETVLVAEGIAHAPVATKDLFQNPPLALQAYLGHGAI